MGTCINEDLRDVVMTENSKISAIIKSITAMMTMRHPHLMR